MGYNHNKIINELLTDVFQNKLNEFREQLFCDLGEFKISSPIERVMFAGISVFADRWDLTYHHHIKENNDVIVYGFIINPQYELGKYRADFCMSYCGDPDSCSNVQKKLIIECDSQEFHDRSEKERRYEKERDRFFQSQGYTVFRFTGKEILTDYKRCVKECFDFVLGHNNFNWGF